MPSFAYLAVLASAFDCVHTRHGNGNTAGKWIFVVLVSHAQTRGQPISDPVSVGDGTDRFPNIFRKVPAHRYINECLAVMTVMNYR